MQLTMYGDVRSVNGVASEGTRAMAPPRWCRWSSACTGRSADLRWKSAKVATASSGRLVDERGREVVRRPRGPQAVEQLLQLDVRQRPDQVGHHRAERAEGLDHVRTLRRIAGPADGDGGDLLEVPLDRQERRRWRGGEVDQRAQLVGRIGDVVAPAGDDLGGVLAGVEHDPAEDGGADGVERQLQRRHDAEVAASAAERPSRARRRRRGWPAPPSRRRSPPRRRAGCRTRGRRHERGGRCRLPA